MQTLSLTVYYDVTCPYCCVAHRRLTEIVGPALHSEHGLRLQIAVKSHQLVSSLPSGNTDPERGPVAPPVDKIEFLGELWYRCGTSEMLLGCHLDPGNIAVIFCLTIESEATSRGLRSQRTRSWLRLCSR